MMKALIAHIRRITLLATMLFATVVIVHAQKPELKSLSRSMGAMDELITIKGSFFGTDATKVAVTFGASKGVIQSITDQQIEVRVPFGTVLRSVSITNLTTGLTGFSTGQFLLNFSGDGA